MKNESLHHFPRISPADLNRNSLNINGNHESHLPLDILEAMTDGVIIINELGLIRFINTSMAEQLDRIDKDLVGFPIPKNLFGMESERIVETINLVLFQGHQPNSIEFRPENEQKTQTCFLLNISPLYSDSGNISGVILVSRDITDYKNTMELLKKDEERFRTILDSVEEGYFELDLAGRVTFSNDWVIRSAGAKIEEINQIPYRDYLTPDSAKKMYKTFNNIYKTGKPAKKIECEMAGRDGKRRFVEVSASLMRNENGNPVGFRGVSRDITERKLSEKSLKNVSFPSILIS